MNINWDVTDTENDLILKIAKRAYALYKGAKVRRRRIDIVMDLTACHANGCPLRLGALLKADDFNLMHDVDGIARHIDHDSGKLTRCFVPRFAAHQS